jgi:peptidoglycan/xylan/chitin deacetylase (PgdA/CDA1 family)
MLDGMRVAWYARRLSGRDFGGVCVLAYHGTVERITDPRLQRNFHELEAFRAQVALLRRLRTVSLAQLSEWLHAGALTARGATVSVTFDDGYANNVQAIAMLREAGVPCTVFVTTDAVTTGRAIWTVELALLLLLGGTTRTEALGQTWPLSTREQREQSFQSVRTRMKALPSLARRAEMDALRGQFGPGESERLLEEHPEFRPLTWESVRSLAASGVEIGSHGVAHELHHDAQPESVRAGELVESKRIIETLTGKPCRYFSFPNGASVAESGRELKAAGYLLGFTTRSGFVRAGADAFTLPRVEPGRSARGLAERLDQRGGAPGSADRT